MSRGKYRTRAEATQVREEATAEAAQLRREVAKLTNDLATEREDHATEVAMLRKRIGKLSALVNEGSSERLEETRDELARVRQLRASDRDELWTKTRAAVHDLLPVEGYRKLAEVFERPESDFTGMTQINRGERRFSQRNPKYYREIERQFGIGVACGCGKEHAPEDHLGK